MIRFLLLCQSYILFNIAQAQTLITIQNELGEALSLATITHLQTKQVWVSDSLGRLQINLNSRAQLQAEYVGYYSQTFNFSGNQSTMIIQLQPQLVALQEVQVLGFEAQRSRMQTPAPIATLSANTIRQLGDHQVLASVNAVPGVRMEERSPGSYRINIRGSALRSPFDVRNVKMYWNDLPLTEPGGNTPFNLLDVINMGSMEIIKGPSASVFGAGMGGVVLMNSPWVEKGTHRLEASTTQGSFGLQRYATQFQSAWNKTRMNAQFADQRTDGYREHSAMHRTTYALHVDHLLNDRQSVAFHGLITNLNYQIPGGLNQQQMEENPRQARAGSVAMNSSIAVQHQLLGAVHKAQWSPRWNSKTAVYFTHSDFENPFLLDYKREKQYSLGGRALAEYENEWSGMPVKWVSGIEYQTRNARAKNFGNAMGQADTLNFDDQLITRQSIVFSQLSIDLPGQWFVQIGFSLNNLQYDINRIADAGLDSAYQFVKNFDPIVVPRVAFLKKLNANHTAFASVGSGFSPPTLEEVRTNEGSLNTDIQAERGINYELGLRGNFLTHKISYEANLFWLRLNPTITDYQSERGTTLFRNSGQTNQRGVELAFNYTFIQKTTGVLRKVRLNNSYTYHVFTFVDYQRGTNNFTGNAFPGVAPHTLVSQLHAEILNGWQLNTQVRHVGEIPLNDANTQLAAAHQVVSATVSYEWTMRFGSITAYFGGDNLLNQSYSLANDLNAFGGRFFQPAAERNWFAGIRFNTTLR